MAKERGIDISTWQGNVDFDKVKSAGIQFLILRSSYRQAVDDKFHKNVAKAKALGIPIRGVYHFSYALNVEQAKQEAAFCISQVESSGLGKDVNMSFGWRIGLVKQIIHVIIINIPVKGLLTVSTEMLIWITGLLILTRMRRKQL